MRSAIGVLILVFFVTLGTGVLGYLHTLQHAWADAQAHARMHVEVSHDDPVPAEHSHPQHDESNCIVHALLSAPVAWQGWVPYLAGLGLLVLFLSAIAPPMVSRRPLLRIDCRGPPMGQYAV